MSDFVTPWTAACQASLSITNSRSLCKLMSIKLMMPSNHLVLCRPLLLLPSIFLSIRVFSNESVLHIKWPKNWSFSFSISPSMDIWDSFPLGLGALSVRMHARDLLKEVHITSICAASSQSWIQPNSTIFPGNGNCYRLNPAFSGRSTILRRSATQRLLSSCGTLSELLKFPGKLISQ